MHALSHLTSQPTSPEPASSTRSSRRVFKSTARVDRKLAFAGIVCGIVLLLPSPIAAAAIDTIVDASLPSTSLDLSSSASAYELEDDSYAEDIVRVMKRDESNARFTFYSVGLGACGGFNSGADFVVALNSPQWEGGAHCNEMITISHNGKTTQAQIVDECEGCSYGSLDFSVGLFSFFADESDGVIYGNWGFGARAPQPEPQPAPVPIPVPLPLPAPLPMWQAYQPAQQQQQQQPPPPPQVPAPQPNSKPAPAPPPAIVPAPAPPSSPPKMSNANTTPANAMTSPRPSSSSSRASATASSVLSEASISNVVLNGTALPVFEDISPPARTAAEEASGSNDSNNDSDGSSHISVAQASDLDEHAAANFLQDIGNVLINISSLILATAQADSQTGISSKGSASASG